MIFDYVKLDEYGFEVKVKTLDYAIQQIKNWAFQKPFEEAEDMFADSL
jgi:hypothetical protein